MRRRLRRQHVPQHLLRGGLADRARHGDDARLRARARRTAKSLAARAACRARHRGGRRPSARRRALHRRPPRPRRPRRRARTWSWPSLLSPLSATNRSPGCSVRVSIEMPVTPSPSAPLTRASSGLTRPSARPQGLVGHARTPFRVSERRADRLVIGKRQDVVSRRSGPFHGPCRRRRECRRRASPPTAVSIAARRSPISITLRRTAARAGENFAADGGGVFGARIVVGDIDDIGVARRDLAHQRTLAAIAIAAAAEHDDEPAPRERTQARRAPSPAHRACARNRRRCRAPSRSPTRSSRPGAPSSCLQRGEHVGGTLARRDREARRDERVRHLERAGERQAHGIALRRHGRARAVVDEARRRRRVRAVMPSPARPTVSTAQPCASRRVDHASPRHRCRHRRRPVAPGGRSVSNRRSFAAR